MKNKLIVYLSVMILILPMMMSCNPSAPVTPALPSQPQSIPSVEPTGPDVVNSGNSISDGQTLLESRCASCHSLDRTQRAKHSTDEWKAIVDKMVLKGASLNAEEESILVDYLAKEFPK